jgi:hypothetical protein
MRVAIFIIDENPLHCTSCKQLVGAPSAWGCHIPTLRPFSLRLPRSMPWRNLIQYRGYPGRSLQRAASYLFPEHTTVIGQYYFQFERNNRRRTMYLGMSSNHAAIHLDSEALGHLRKRRNQVIYAGKPVSHFESWSVSVYRLQLHGNPGWERD